MSMFKNIFIVVISLLILQSCWTEKESPIVEQEVEGNVVESSQIPQQPRDEDVTFTAESDTTPEDQRNTFWNDDEENLKIEFLRLIEAGEDINLDWYVLTPIKKEIQLQCQEEWAFNVDRLIELLEWETWIPLSQCDTPDKCELAEKDLYTTSDLIQWLYLIYRWELNVDEFNTFIDTNSDKISGGDSESDALFSKYYAEVISWNIQSEVDCINFLY